MNVPPPRADTLGGTIVLIVLGLLVLLPSGLCTGYFGITGLTAMMGGHDSQGLGEFFFFAALVLGGPFVVAGGAMLWVGIRRWRKR